MSWTAEAVNADAGEPKAADAASAVAKRIGVAVDRRRAAEMGVEDLRSRREKTLLYEVDHALHGFTLIDGSVIMPSSRAQRRMASLVSGDGIHRRVSIILDQDHIVGDDLPAEFDELGGVLRDRKHLRLGLRRRKGRVDADHLARAAVLANPTTMPAWVEPVTVQTMT